MALFSKKEESPKMSAILPEDIYEEGVRQLREVIAPSALQIAPKNLHLGEKVTRTFFVISYPRFLAEGWFSPVINLDKVFDISIYVHPVDTATVMRKLQKKVAEIQSQIATSEEKGLVRDPLLETAYHDVEQLRDQLQQAREKLFDVGLYITLYADTEDELTKVESEIKSILESRLIFVKPALFQQEQGFKTVIPTADDQLAIHTKLNSSPLSSLFPFISFDLTSDKGILYGINRHNAGLVLFDRFSLENYNSVVFSKAGAGKSIEKNSPVLIRKNGKVSLEKIGAVIENSIKKNGLEKIDADLEGVVNPGFEVWSFDKELRGSWSPVTVAARKEAQKDY